MNKKLIGLLFVGVFLILTLSLVMAIHNPHHNPRQNPHNINNSLNDSNSSLFNFTNPRLNYGLCVSNYTKIKNNCFNETREVRKLCRNNVLEFIHNFNNSTSNNETNLTNFTNISKKDFAKQIRLINKVCRDEYNIVINKCKDDFKLNKDSCRQYKCNEKKNETWINESCTS